MPKISTDVPAIRVQEVTKDFVLPHLRANSVKSTVTGLFKKRSERQKSSEVQHALRGVSFEVKQGEFFGILGRNGSGKSTLLKMLAGIYQSTSGNIDINGKLVPFIELGVGFNPELTGRENVFLNGALLGFTKKEIESRYDEIVSFAELERFMDQKLKNYSSGMQVRLAFAVAVTAQADILLVDEVLAVGDADFQRKCYDYFKSLKKQKKTVVFVTHDMGAVREYCDRAVLIKNGIVAHEGSADAVADEYLKMFNEASKTEEEAVEEADAAKRWGNGKIVFDSVKANTVDDKVQVVMTIRCGPQPIEDVVVGLRFQDSEGKLLAGTNTPTCLNGKTLSFAANETKQLVFQMPNIFSGGTVSVGGSIQLSDRVTIFDDWEGATELTIVKTKSYYPILCPATLELKERL